MMAIIILVVLGHVCDDENLTVKFCFPEKQLLKPNDVSVFSTVNINGRLFACPRDTLNSIVRHENFF